MPHAARPPPRRGHRGLSLLILYPDLSDADLRRSLRQADHLLLLGVVNGAVTETHSSYSHRTRRHYQEGDASKALGIDVACLQVPAVPAHASQAVRGRNVGRGLDHVDVNLQRRLTGRVSAQFLRPDRSSRHGPSLWSTT